MTGIGTGDADWEATEADVAEQSRGLTEDAGGLDEVSVADGKPEADVLEQLLPAAGEDSLYEDDYPR
jgi:hypothetical protein